MEKEPETEEEFNAAKIRIGDDLKAHLDSKDEKLVLKRVKTLIDLPGALDREECDYTLHEQDHNHMLTRVFLQTNSEAKRIYVDFAPEKHFNFLEALEGNEKMQEDMTEQHDNEACEYWNFEEAETLFKDHKLYIEVE